MKTRNKIIVTVATLAALGGAGIAGVSMADQRGHDRWERGYHEHRSDDGHGARCERGRRHEGRGGYRDHGRRMGMGMDGRMERRHDEGEYGYRGRDGRPDRRAERLFEEFDSDDDARLTLAELGKVRDERLRAFDGDGNGQLNLDEYKALWLDAESKRIEARFGRLDGDGDGTVTGDEFRAPLERMLSRFDRDDDGEVTRDDLLRR